MFNEIILLKCTHGIKETEGKKTFALKRTSPLPNKSSGNPITNIARKGKPFADSFDYAYFLHINNKTYNNYQLPTCRTDKASSIHLEHHLALLYRGQLYCHLKCYKWILQFS